MPTSSRRRDRVQLLNQNAKRWAVFGVQPGELQVARRRAEADALLSQLQLDPNDVEPEAGADLNARSLPIPRAVAELRRGGRRRQPGDRCSTPRRAGGGDVESFLPCWLPAAIVRGEGKRFVIRSAGGGPGRAPRSGEGGRPPDGGDDEPRARAAAPGGTYAVPTPWRGCRLSAGAGARAARSWKPPLPYRWPAPPATP